ncbi:MAG: anti-sigma factor [Mesorhizobium sp.]|nr:anti-sigma factor [Mesorhizobium sp.]MBL8577598.1 anti-sigma factor [Mesorhizobium sp.]
MSLLEDMDPAGGSDDIVAAEYVLGVQSGEERQMVAARIENEQAFARLVDGWDSYFAPLGAAYVEVTAPISVKSAVDRRLFAAETASVAPRESSSGPLSSLVFWRGLAAAVLAALMVYIALPYLRSSAPSTGERLVASLVADGSGVSYLAFYDDRTNEVGLSRLTGEPSSGRDFELWVIQGQQPPLSLGVIPAGRTATLPVADPIRQKVVSGALFAISDEPAGGSTTGLPTGPVVAAGDLKPI